MRKFVRRETVAAILLPALYIYIMELPKVYFFALVLGIAIIAMVEFCGFYKTPQILTLEVVLFSALYLYSRFQDQDILSFVILFMTLTLLITRLLFFKKGPEGAIRDLAPALVGFFYVIYLLQFALLIREKGPEWVIYLFAAVWTADSMAYYLGKTFGKRRLYPAVSPQKTVEGALGSILGGIGASVVMKYLLVETTIEKALLAGFLIGFVSIIGDLTESMFKRDAGVKDSSRIIPAHGGILDKIDGMIFCCPVVYFLFCL